MKCRHLQPQCKTCYVMSQAGEKAAMKCRHLQPQCKTCYVMSQAGEKAAMKCTHLQPQCKTCYVMSLAPSSLGHLTHNSQRTQMLQPPFYLPSKIRVLLEIRFHPSHQLFSRLINHSTVSLNIPLGDQVFLVRILSNLVNRIPRCKQKQGTGVAGMVSLTKVLQGVSSFSLLAIKSGKHIVYLFIYLFI